MPTGVYPRKVRPLPTPPCTFCGSPVVLKNRHHYWRWQKIGRVFHKECAHKHDAQNQSERMRSPDHPSHDPEVSARMSATLKLRGHRPKTQGGKGRGLTAPQKWLLDALGPDWIPEHTVPTGLAPRPGPTHYNIDLALPSRMIAVEIDGSDHSALKVKARDRRKEHFLAARGWRVLRFSNKSIMDSVSYVAATIRSTILT